MIQKPIKSKNGFTLIELLLFMGLFSVILTVLMSFFATIVDTQLSVQATSAVESDSKYIVSRLMYDIQRASSIETPVGLGESSPTLTLTIGGVIHVYSRVDNALQITVGAETSRLESVGSRLDSLSFRRVGNVGGKNAIQVSYTITNNVESPIGADSKTVVTTVKLR